jgi:hypothetical protein
MRTVLLAAAVVSLATPALWAQQNRPASTSGFGRIMFPGGVGPSAGARTPGTTTLGSGRIIGNVGVGAPAIVRNPGRNVVMQPPVIRHGAHNNAIVVPYPVYVGGGYYDYGPPPPLFMENFSRPSQLVPPQPVGALFMENFSTISPQNLATYTTRDQDQSPVVIVNQYFTPDTPVPSTNPPTAAAKPTAPQTSAPLAFNTTPDPVVFLIAMKDHTVYSASSYYVDGRLLNYTTMQGAQNTVSLDLVDQDLSRRLNRDRSVAFALPLN